MARKFFVIGSLMLWFIIVVFCLYVLKTGGHLRPKAAGVENVGFSVSGKVVFGDTGISGAKIMISRDGKNNYGYTDSGGNFTFGNLNGTYKLKVEKEGFKPAEANVVAQEEKFQNIILVK